MPIGAGTVSSAVKGWWAATFPMPGQSTIVTLQWLRFLAATTVVLAHVTEKMVGMQERYDVAGGHIAFSGAFGVRVFFAISGFIMIYVASEKFGSWRNAGYFIRNRFLRIAPLYWVLTVVYAALILVSGSSAVEPGRITWPAVLQSLAFIPYLNWNGAHRPVLEVGWTLDFEMMFYGLFALCLMLPRRFGLGLLIGLLLIIGLVPGAGLPTPFSLWANDIVLYFLIGIGFAFLRKAILARGALPLSPLRPAVGAVLAMGGYLLVLNLNSPLLPTGLWQALFVALAMSFAVLVQDEGRGTAFSRIAIGGGDASYSLYLAHGFALLFVGIAWRKVFGGSLMVGYYWLAFVASMIAGLVCYALLERPLTAFFARLVGREPRPMPFPRKAPHLPGHRSP